MVDEPGGIHATPFQDAQHRAMELEPAQRRQRLLVRVARELVPEAQRLPLDDEQPRALALAIAAPASPRWASTSHSSAAAGTTDTSSSTARAAPPSRTARASTASRTVAGTRGPPAAASASVTRNGFPPVAANSASASASGPASSATASRDSGSS